VRVFAYVILAFLSGIPALVYQVVWSREVALFLGSQIEALSIVLVTFFGGLAAGSRIFGALTDRVRAPLRLFGLLESTGGVLAVASPLLLRWMATSSVVALPLPARFVLAGLTLFPIPFLLGGTAPALTRSAVREITRTAAAAGWIIGANTAGAVLGVVVAMIVIPSQGLRTTILAAGSLALVVGVIAILVARPWDRPVAVDGPPTPLPAAPLVAAFVAGMATLAFEVLATRAAALLLGSTLHAWACVLALLLAGLALGTAVFGHRASGARRPEIELGVVETAAALTIAGGLTWIVPDLSMPAPGITAQTALTVALCILPPAFFMGAAFPYFVRLAVPGLSLVGKAFGTVSAFNTAGGIAGALLVPFLLLPALGLPAGLFACACVNGFLGAFFVLRGAPSRRTGRLAAVLGVILFAIAAVPAFRAPPAALGRRVIYLEDGAQASAAVVRTGGNRELIVDGDPEAGTARDALETETLLAALPLALHPGPRDFLEVGLGSGITLGTAARFPLEKIECVEIAPPVIAAARYFEPENGRITRDGDSRVRIIRDDGRAFLARQQRAYDIIVANTLHPWSIGATGLYSHEYFERIAKGLKPGGIAVQWVPIARISGASLAAILRTFFSVFGAGSVWWGSENLLLVGVRPGPHGQGPPPADLEAGGRRAPPDVLARAGLGSVQEIDRRRLASAAAARKALGAGPILTDDVPLLETEGARRRPMGVDKEVTVLVDRIARAGALDDPRTAPMATWIGARLARAQGLDEKADRLEARAEDAGLDLARRSRLGRVRARAAAALNRGRAREAEEVLRAVLREDPGDRDAGYALAMIAVTQNDLKVARRELDRVVRDHPGFGEGWNTLGVVRRQGGDRAGAREAFSMALEADPYFPEALANAGLTATEAGDEATARAMLARLRALSPFGPTAEEKALMTALASTFGRTP